MRPRPARAPCCRCPAAAPELVRFVELTAAAARRRCIPCANRASSITDYCPYSSNSCIVVLTDEVDQFAKIGLECLSLEWSPFVTVVSKQSRNDLSRAHLESCSTTCCSLTTCTSRLCLDNTSATSTRAGRTKGLANAYQHGRLQPTTRTGTGRDPATARAQ